MKGVIAILGLLVCASAFQYSMPENGFGHRNPINDDIQYSRVYGHLQGPFSPKHYHWYQNHKVNDDYQKDDSVYDRMLSSYYKQDLPDQHQDVQDVFGNYKDIYNEYYNGIYNKYLGKMQNLFKKYQSNEYPEQQTVYTHEQENVQKPVVRQMDDIMTPKQQHIYQLVKYINSPIYDNHFQEILKTFNIEQHAQDYKTEAYEHFMYLWQNELFLPKGQIFSVMNDVHVEQVKALFDLLYTAKDYNTFYKTAVQAREHINEGMFLYTYSVAILHRPDTQGLFLPPIYEIYPHYFFSSEVIQKAYNHKMTHFGRENSEKVGVYTIRSNYSGYYLNLNPEQSLSYYSEDVGINAFYYYYNLFQPYWMESKEYQLDEKRGELFYYVHQQLLARYYLERLSHGVGGIEYFNWNVPFETGYYPSLTYPNGLAFNERPNFASLEEYFYNYGQRWCFVSKYGYGYTYVTTYEQRIREAIDLGYAYTMDGDKVNLYTPKGFNILANIIEGNADSPNYRYYGSFVNFARHLLGYSKQPLDNYSLAPSALEHYETSLRDPAFYQLAKKMVLLFQKYKANLPVYTKKDLYFPGVKVERLEVDPLVTFYDKFYSDITNGLTVTPEEYATDSTFRIQVEQYRLNHKNFNYKVYVNSDKAIKALIKVFIGPKFDEHGRIIDFNENRMNFFEIDTFVTPLKTGQNIVVRNSRNFIWFGKDKTSLMDVYRNVMSSTHNNADNVDVFMNGFPQRCMLPRGSEGGMSFQMYVFVHPYTPDQNERTDRYYQTTDNQGTVVRTESIQHEQVYDRNTQYTMIRVDSHPIGYPFDRPVEFEQVYHVPNAYLKDVKVYHKVLGNGNFEGQEFTREHPIYFM